MARAKWRLTPIEQSILAEAIERRPVLGEIIEAHGRREAERILKDMNKPCPLLDAAMGKPRRVKKAKR